MRSLDDLQAPFLDLGNVFRVGRGGEELPNRLMDDLNNSCYMRRIWAPKISFFVPYPRDTAHPGSGSAQVCLPLLRLSANFGTLRRSMLKCFNSSQVSPDLVAYINMAKISLHFKNEQSCLYLVFFFVLLTWPQGT